MKLMTFHSLTGVTAAATVAALVSVAAPAHAFAIAGTSSGSWGLPGVPTPSTILSNENGGTDNRLSWGTPVTDSFANYVQFDGASISALSGSQFKVGDLTYRNGSTTDNFDGDFPLSVSLSLHSPTNLNPTFSFLFNILNTPNTGNPITDADRLRFSTAGLSGESFNVGGVDYTLLLTGFSADGGTTFISEFNAPEGAIARAGLYGKVIPTAEAVPEPTTMAGLALAGAGLAAARRRRK